MLTFFTTAKPFEGHSGIIQRNALKSWKRLHPDIEVILFGDEQGVPEVCAQLNLRHEPHVERCSTGQKYINYLFSKAQEIAHNHFVCYSNCDIVLLEDFWKAFLRIRDRSQSLLMIGKRWDTDISQAILFDSSKVDQELRAQAMAQARQRQYEVDYFLFSKGLFAEIPPLVNGRIYWDHWLIWKALSSAAAVIDASFAVTAIHQNHDYGYHPQGMQGVFEDKLARHNYELAGNGKHLRTFEDSTHLLLRPGLLLRTPLRKQFHALLRWSFYLFVHKTLPVRKVLRLRREHFRKLFFRRSRSSG
jgi:hypothetical protein